MSTIDAPTVAQLAELAADAYGPRTALRFKRAGVWRSLSYSQLTKAVEVFATGLLEARVPSRPSRRRWPVPPRSGRLCICRAPSSRRAGACRR
ncbi:MULTISPECIES: hypothetical protein [unclassified Streptomyces]|uniref:hypothetical protein n=1 Tax=unclassified Streptomyces TaxID=2593676 RepID=UPI002DD8905F|nr:hypothetical protein [Streptomyces sp. NBC_01750]WSA98578.1 hypothetical protein OIE54_04505 [Streptomyces sp. NBC_01794]WSD36886.1 hypothetical protein OG966_36280 [Streptomyces sp. NBC_01750]